MKLCVLVATPLLIVTTADALRSHLALGLGVDAGRSGKGLFRLAWVAASVVGLAAIVAAAIAALLAHDPPRLLARW